MQATNIPVKLIKGNSIFLQNKNALISMNLLVKENFPNCLKLANITPGFKKGNPLLFNISMCDMFLILKTVH